MIAGTAAEFEAFGGSSARNSFSRIEGALAQPA
jgi:hypothetical protein